MKRWIVAAAAAGALALTACGGNDAGTTAAARDGGSGGEQAAEITADACGLLTVEQVSEYAGVEMKDRDADDHVAGEPNDRCTYVNAGSEAPITLFVTLEPSGDDTFAEGGLDPVDGLVGDRGASRDELFVAEKDGVALQLRFLALSGAEKSSSKDMAALGALAGRTLGWTGTAEAGAAPAGGDSSGEGTCALLTLDEVEAIAEEPMRADLDGDDCVWRPVDPDHADPVVALRPDADAAGDLFETYRIEERSETFGADRAGWADATAMVQKGDLYIGIDVAGGPNDDAESLRGLVELVAGRMAG